jgi:hypothetical protein
MEAHDVSTLVNSTENDTGSAFNQFRMAEAFVTKPGKLLDVSLRPTKLLDAVVYWAAWDSSRSLLYNVSATHLPQEGPNTSLHSAPFSPPPKLHHECHRK